MKYFPYFLLKPNLVTEYFGLVLLLQGEAGTKEKALLMTFTGHSKEPGKNIGRMIIMSWSS